MSIFYNVGIWLFLILSVAQALPPKRVGTRWRDSIGVNINDGDATYTLPRGSLLFHTTVWLDFSDSSNKWYSLDLAQSVMHNRNLTEGGKKPPEYFAVHVFRTKDPLELFLINPYSTTFPTIVSMNKGVDPMGQRPDITKDLVQAVCESGNGWRNPWDQDEVMFCQGHNAQSLLTYVGTIQVKQEQQQLSLLKESPIGSGKLSEVTIAPLFGGQNGVFSFAVRDFMSGTALSQGRYFTSSDRHTPVNVNNYFWPRFYNAYDRMCSQHISPDYNNCASTYKTDLAHIVQDFSDSDISIYIAPILQHYDCGFAQTQSTFPYFGSLKLIETTEHFKDFLNSKHYVDITCTPK